MPRNRRHIRELGPFHVTTRTNNREWFNLDASEVWVVYTDLLNFTARAFSWEVQAFVLMSNHTHMLVRTPENNLPEGMLYIQREFSREMNRRTGRVNHLFGGRYYASLIRDWMYHHAAYKYLYRNPVDAGIVQRPEAYPYSSLAGILGLVRLPIPIFDPMDVVEETDAILEWLNSAFRDDQRERIRAGFRFAEFKWTVGSSRRDCWSHDLTYAKRAPK